MTVGIRHEAVIVIGAGRTGTARIAEPVHDRRSPHCSLPVYVYAAECACVRESSLGFVVPRPAVEAAPPVDEATAAPETDLTGVFGAEWLERMSGSPATRSSVATSASSGPSITFPKLVMPQLDVPELEPAGVQQQPNEACHCTTRVDKH